EVRCPYARNAGVAGALRVACRPSAPAFRGVGVVEEASERSPLDERRALGGHALVVERRGVRADLQAAVVDQRDELRTDLLADELGEERTSLLDGLRRERSGEDAEEARGGVRIEHDRDPSGRRLRRTEEPRRALRCG